jgi:hypothetical protein
MFPKRLKAHLNTTNYALFMFGEFWVDKWILEGVFPKIGVVSLGFC